MAMQTIKNGGFVAEELGKINSNFALCAEKTELPSKTSDLTNDSGFITSANVPTKTSDLSNDSGFITQADVPTKTSQLTNDSNFATTAQIPTVPTKVSQLQNDSGFVTSAAIPTNVSALTNDAGYAKTSEVNASVANAKATKVEFTATNWTNGTFTTAANGKMPTGVMRKNGSNYGAVLVDVQVIGTNVVITSDESFEGYVILV